MIQKFQGVEIKAITSCVPKKVISNDFFEDLLAPKERRIFEKTVGILERRWADDHITASDLGFEAASLLLSENRIDKTEIESLIFLSQTPDFQIPFTSNILQHRLGLKKEILCLDINAGCAGFIQGLSTSFSIAKSLPKGKVLFIIAETLSKIISTKDRGTAMLFGDGAAAILVENTENLKSKASFNFFSDGGNADAIMIPDGGYRNKVTPKSFEPIGGENKIERNKVNLAMDGPRVFDFTLREIAPKIKELLHANALDINSIDYYLLHQSNQFIIKQIASQLGVEAEKMLINIQHFGNTSGVSIPLVMASNNVAVSNSKSLLLSGYGSGLNWGNCLLNMPEMKISCIKEI
jgi:3-oxoacyl-[acyl-carrier-protein] synthase III